MCVVTDKLMKHGLAKNITFKSEDGVCCTENLTLANNQ